MSNLEELLDARYGKEDLALMVLEGEQRIDELLAERDSLQEENRRMRNRCTELQQKIDNMAAEHVAGRKGEMIKELRKRIAELEQK